MKERKGFFGQDECYEDYCLTKCDRFPSRYIGSTACHYCRKYISEREEPGAVVITCKS